MKFFSFFQFITKSFAERDDTDVQEWFHVTPTNNIWNVSRITIRSQYRSTVAMRIEFAIWDAYIDDIRFLHKESCISTHQHRSRTGIVSILYFQLYTLMKYTLHYYVLLGYRLSIL